MAKEKAGTSSASALVQALGQGISGGDRATVRMGRRGMELLGNVPLFAGLSHRHLRKVADLAEVVRFGEGREVVREGLRGSAFYVIAEGRAKVVRGGRTVRRLGPGEFFGEMALLDDRPRTATVLGETSLVTVKLDRAQFHRLIEAEPRVAIAVLKEMARRLREDSRRSSND